jgi:hypothetical protein
MRSLPQWLDCNWADETRAPPESGNGRAVWCTALQPRRFRRKPLRTTGLQVIRLIGSLCETGGIRKVGVMIFGWSALLGDQPERIDERIGHARRFRLVGLGGRFRRGSLVLFSDGGQDIFMGQACEVQRKRKSECVEVVRCRAMAAP